MSGAFGAAFVPLSPVTVSGRDGGRHQLHASATAAFGSFVPTLTARCLAVGVRVTRYLPDSIVDPVFSLPF